MSAFDSNDPRDEALWQLLGGTRPVEPSPYFARKVLRAIEADTDPAPAWWTVFLPRFVPAAACTALAVFAVASIFSPAPAVPIANTEIEFETIENLDLLVSTYESSLWLDSSSSY